MTRKISFSIPGEPRGKARPRATADIIWRGNVPEPVVRLVTPKETVQAEKEILAIFRQRFPDHEPWTGAVLIRFTAVFETPKSFNRALKEAAARGALYCTKKPDKDNIEKLIADALTPPQRKRGSDEPVSPRGYAWVEDAQIMGGGIKRYGSPARIDVTLELLDTPDMPATPGRKRAEARVAADREGKATTPPRRNQTKSGKKKPEPTPLQLAIEAAIKRDAGYTPAQRAFFGEDD